MQNTVYWTGADGNVYQRIGNSVKNQGKLIKDYGNGFDAQYLSAQSKRIDDPNPPTPSAADAINSAAQKQIAALQQQLAAMPKLPVYNTADAWSRAQSKAGSVVNPVYQDKLNNQLAIYNAKRTQESQITTRSKEDLDTNYGQLLEDTATERGRTAEDVATNLNEINYQEGQFQDQEGKQFDTQNRADRVALAEAGLSQSGLGAQKLENSVIDRNTMTDDQLRTFDNQKLAQQTVQKRAFEDLDRKDTRGAQLTERQKQDLDIQLENTLTNIQLDENVFRAGNEADRLGAMYTATQQAYNTDIRNWLASLSKQGWRAQDIALATQVYG